MIKNNKGVALAYTLMMMLFVFAICAVITSITLAQIANTNRYANHAATERIYLQIGEIFCAAYGDYTIEESEPDTKSRFEVALNNASFTIDSSSDKWHVELDNHKFLLEFSTNTDVNELEIKNADGTKIYLTVGIKTNGQIVKWTKGTADGQGS